MLTSFVAVDTETTGLDFEHDRVIELAAVRFEHGEPVATFTALLSPGDRALSPVSRLITGITDAELAAAPPRPQSLQAFLDFAGDSPLVAHNAEFDAHFVRHALEAESLPPLPGTWIDSLLLSRIAWPTWDSHRLDSLAERLEIPRGEEHRALPDARRAGYVFLAAWHHLRDTLSQTGWDALASLSAELPDWKLVFTGTNHSEGPALGAGTTADGSAASPGDGTETSRVVAGEPAADRASPAEREQADEALREKIAEELATLVAEESWLALETPAPLNDNAAGLAAALDHLAGAGAGARILLAVPDAYAWNTLRKNLPASAVKITALAEPSGYLCRARLAALGASPAAARRIPPAERAALLPLVAWADRNPEGPVADGRGFSPDRARLTWSRVQCDSWNDDPAARAAREAAATSALILVTHATLCAHVASAGALLPACDAVIVTGAHRYADTAQSPAGAGRVLSLFRLRETLSLMSPAPAKGPEGDGAAAIPTTSETTTSQGDETSLSDSGLWGEIAPLVTPSLDEAVLAAARDRWFAPDRELQKFLQKAGKAAAKAGQGGGNDYRIRYTESLAALGADPEPVRAALRANEEFLAAALSALAAPDGQAADFLVVSLQRLAARLRAVRADFEFLTAAADGDTVFWIEDGANPHKTTLRAVPRAMEPFGDALRDLFGAGLFLSPALLTGGDTDRDARPFLRATGLQTSPDSAAAEVSARRVEDPGLAASAPAYLMAPFAPAPNAGEQMEAYARFLLDAAGPLAAHGVLVFCPSQTAVRALYGALRNALRNGAPAISDGANGGGETGGDTAADAPETGPRVLAQWIDGNRDAVARLYAAGQGGFVIASEGIPGLRDAEGRVPALWLLTRMPFPPPRDPVLEARGEPLRAAGLNPRTELWQPAAVQRIKREWTMLHRDGASPPRAIWLLDARAATEGLGARLGAALGVRVETARNVEELRGRTGENLF